jgi:hypothetical protein
VTASTPPAARNEFLTDSDVRAALDLVDTVLGHFTQRAQAAEPFTRTPFLRDSVVAGWRGEAARLRARVDAAVSS